MRGLPLGRCSGHNLDNNVRETATRLATPLLPPAPAPSPPQVAHILVAPEQKALIPQLRRRILDGEATLAELAAEHSTCPSRRCGGAAGSWVGGWVAGWLGG